MAILINPKRTLVDGTSKGELFIKTESFIPDSFFEACRAKRDASMSAPMGEMHQFASIPADVYQTWMAEGFDPAKVGAKAVMDRLRKEGLDAFITTNRTL